MAFESVARRHHGDVTEYPVAADAGTEADAQRIALRCAFAGVAGVQEVGHLHRPRRIDLGDLGGDVRARVHLDETHVAGQSLRAGEETPGLVGRQIRRDRYAGHAHAHGRSQHIRAGHHETRRARAITGNELALAEFLHAPAFGYLQAGGTIGKPMRTQRRKRRTAAVILRRLDHPHIRQHGQQRRLDAFKLALRRGEGGVLVTAVAQCQPGAHFPAAALAVAERAIEGETITARGNPHVADGEIGKTRGNLVDLPARQFQNIQALRRAERQRRLDPGAGIADAQPVQIRFSILLRPPAGRQIKDKARLFSHLLLHRRRRGKARGCRYQPDSRGQNSDP